MYSMCTRVKIFTLILAFLLSCSSFSYLPGEIIKAGPYAGYFMPNDELLEQIYGGKDVTYGLKLGVHLWKGFYAYMSGQKYQQYAETLLGDVTRLSITPVYLSLRYTLELGAVNPYLGSGYTFVHFKEESDIGNTTGNGNGFTFDAGIEFTLSDRFTLDLGAKYCRLPVNPSELEEAINLGGLEVGISFLTVF